MKKLIFVVLLTLPIVTRAADKEDTYNSVEYLQKDLEQVSLVELIHPLNVAPDNSVKAMGNVYRTNSRVVESFKGDVKVGDLIAFYATFEDKPNGFYGGKDRIVFLTRVKDEEHNRWILWELENSSREASRSNLEKLRRISHQSKMGGPATR